jgi:hypothetical protein
MAPIVPVGLGGIPRGVPDQTSRSVMKNVRHNARDRERRTFCPLDEHNVRRSRRGSQRGTFFCAHDRVIATLTEFLRGNIEPYNRESAVISTET